MQCTSGVFTAQRTTHLAYASQLLVECKCHMVAKLLLLLGCLLQVSHVSGKLRHAAVLQHLLRDDG